VTPRKAERVPQRSWNPVKWLTSRDRTTLNFLGLALLGAGAATAVATWLARFTSKAVPWWPVIVGLVVVALGFVLALATTGAQRETVPDSSIGDAGESAPSVEQSALPRDEAKSVQPSADRCDDSEAEEPTQSAQKYSVRVRGDVHGLAQGDNQNITMNFGTPSKGSRDPKHTEPESSVHDGE
jgi:hypothetical protein